MSNTDPMPAATTIFAVANRIIEQSKERNDEHENRRLTHLRLQKLVYFAFGYFLAKKKQPLFAERPQIWAHGPNFGSLYIALQGYGTRTLQGPIYNAPKNFDIVDDGSEAQKCVDWVENRYSMLLTADLSTLAHRDGGAWSKAGNELGGSLDIGTTIPDRLIIEEFMHKS